MFKKLLVVGAVAFSLVIGSASSAFAADYKEGVNYVVKGDTLTKTKEIREYFSYWCSHCFALQPTFEKVRDAFPEANFVRNPVEMLGGPMAIESQRATVIANNMGLEDQFVKELFDQMHVKGNIPQSREEMAAIAAKVGIPTSTYNKEVNSFVVLGRVADFTKWNKHIDIEAVPEILVNGKYLVTMESVNNDQELIDLIRYLLNKDKLPNKEGK